MSNKSSANPDVDEVERLRQVRRQLENRFATTAEFLDWLQQLETVSGRRDEVSTEVAPKKTSGQRVTRRRRIKRRA
jgi:hypothetical protein